MHVTALQYFLSIAGTVLQLGTAIVLFRKNLHGRYRLFFAYTCYWILVSLVQFIALRWFPYKQYFWCYWLTTELGLLTGMACILGRLENSLSHVRNASQSPRLWPLAALLSISVLATLLRSGAGIVQHLMVLDYHLQILQLALIILLFAFVRRARPLIQMDNGIILGFAVLSASFLFAWLKRSFLPETTRDLTAELLPMASFCVSNAIWLFSGLTESSATTPPQQVNQISQGPTLPEMASVTSSAPPFEVPAAKEPVETLVPRKKTKAKKVRVDREIDHLRLGIHEPRFRMGTLISCGAMGMVYRAYDNERQHPVALKFIYREQRQNPHSMKRFRREALIGGKLRHENICKIYGFEENPADAFIIMEYVTGKNLERHIFKGRNEDQIAELLPIFLQIADALDHAHTRHVLHRDIKPGNVVLSRKRIVKLVDFGTAKLKEPPLSNLTGDNLIGTLAYCPPELIQNKAATVQSDLYSFGCLMYALTTGSHPFLASTHSEMILAIERNDLRPPKNLNPNMPVGLEEIILRSLKRDLDERYASAAQIWTDLRNVYRRRASKEAA